jgi:hypothetical protein
MVRSGLSGGLPLRYRASPMNGGTDGADGSNTAPDTAPDQTPELDPSAVSVLATTAGGGAGSKALESAPASSRPWTPAAAMEPLPPLAPPPARPRAGTQVVTTAARTRDGRSLLFTVAGFLALALVVAVLVLLVKP